MDFKIPNELPGASCNAHFKMGLQVDLLSLCLLLAPGRPIGTLPCPLVGFSKRKLHYFYERILYEIFME